MFEECSSVVQHVISLPAPHMVNAAQNEVDAEAMSAERPSEHEAGSFELRAEEQNVTRVVDCLFLCVCHAVFVVG